MSLCIALACEDALTAPRIVAAGPVVTTDRDVYALQTFTTAGIQYFHATGSATFHNVTDRTVYLPRACVPAPATVWLQRDDGTRVGLIDDATCAYLVLYGSDPKAIPVLAGDSLVQSFELFAGMHAPATDAQISGITGSVHLLFDVSATPTGHAAVPGLDSAMSHSSVIVITAQ